MLLSTVMEGCSLDGFSGKLQLVSADDIKHVYALESQSTYSLFIFCVCVAIMFDVLWMKHVMQIYHI